MVVVVAAASGLPAGGTGSLPVGLDRRGPGEGPHPLPLSSWVEQMEGGHR